MSPYEKRRYQTNERLARRNHNPYKIKRQLVCTETVRDRFYCVRWHPWTWVKDAPVVDWDNPVRHSYFRPIHTTPEKRWNEAHLDEYGPSIVRPRRQKRLLPDSYWDKYCNMWSTDRSWKHNSKRRKQWKRYSIFESHS